MYQNYSGNPNTFQNNLNSSNQSYQMSANPYPHQPAMNYNRQDQANLTPLKDYGKMPIVVNLETASAQNTNFRTALWTGEHLQLTLMSIPVGEEIGLEVHPNLDQFVRIEDGLGLVSIGDTPDNLNFQTPISRDFAFIIPAGKYHNLVNTGTYPLKLYSIYGPTQHQFGTVHATKADAGE